MDTCERLLLVFTCLGVGILIGGAMASNQWKQRILDHNYVIQTNVVMETTLVIPK